MARIDFRLDTDPMAHQIGRVKSHVDGATAAVVTMQAAVIAAENEAANHVCSNVNKGFHTLIRSQISQKIARLTSEIEAKTLELSQQSIALNNIKNRMTRDYHMISRRYGKLFNSINASLKQQIFEIDKQAVSFVNNDMKLQSKRMQQLLGTVPINQSESVLLSQSISTSRTKQNGAKLIGSMKKFISNLHYQDYLTRSIVFKKSVQKQQDFYLPVIVASSQAGDVSNLRYFLPVDDSSKVTDIIDNEIKGLIYHNAESFNWKPIDSAGQKRVTNEFQAMVMNCSDSDRVKVTMLSLFDKAGTINQLTE